MAVFVLDKHKNPLMPCSEKRARLLLQRGRAIVHKKYPFTIRLKGRQARESQFQPTRLKLDPGSKTTGVAIIRENKSPKEATVLHLAELNHKQFIHKSMEQRSNYRRRRRGANLRYRSPRFNNRARPKGWLAPSLRARVENVKSWADRYCKLVPISSVSIEMARFDTQALQNPGISGVEYQHGTLFGYEIKEYLLEKWERKCAYCGKKDVPLESEHIVPKSRGGTNRVSNLTISCVDCNKKKGSLTAEEYGRKIGEDFSSIQKQAKQPLKDAAAINSTRWAIYNFLRKAGFFIEAGTGGRTKHNRKRLEIPKTHALDALCVGVSTPEEIVNWENFPILDIGAIGRGQYRRTNVNKKGFPRGYLPRKKRQFGFQTGDIAKAEIPTGKKNAGVHIGKVTVRSCPRFRVNAVDGIHPKHLQLIQRVDGYQYKAKKGQRKKDSNAGQENKKQNS